MTSVLPPPPLGGLYSSFPPLLLSLASPSPFGQELIIYFKWHVFIHYAPLDQAKDKDLAELKKFSLYELLNMYVYSKNKRILKLIDNIKIAHFKNSLLISSTIMYNRKKHIVKVPSHPMSRAKP